MRTDAPPALLLLLAASARAFSPSPPPSSVGRAGEASRSAPLRMSSLPPGIQNRPTELPDSLGDAAAIAANVRRTAFRRGGWEGPPERFPFSAPRVWDSNRFGWLHSCWYNEKTNTDPSG